MSAFIGQWRKKNSALSITVAIRDSNLQVTFNETSSPAIETTDTSFTMNWSAYNKSEWETETFQLVSQNELLSKGRYVWYRVLPGCLNAEDADFFKINGFLQIKGVVSEYATKYAKKSILSHIGQFGLPPEKLVEYNARSFVPALRDNEAERQPLMSVIHQSPLHNIVEGVLGSHIPLNHPPQVAMRYPSPLSHDTRPAAACYSGVHIDGISTPTNGVKGDYLHSFTMLVGVALTDQNTDWSGNLTVYPGSHQICCDVLNRQWAEQEAANIPPQDRILGPGHGAGWERESGVPPEVMSSGVRPVQLKMEAGDVVLLHYQLAHCVAPNRSDDTRINLYWRVSRDDHSPSSLLDLWKDFDGLRG